jgi:hypothetical protein
VVKPIRLAGAMRSFGRELPIAMTSSPSASWLSGIAAPLTAKFGADLTVSRMGNMVCWGYDGQSAVIEMMSDGALRATFIDCERVDEVSASAAAAVYRARGTYTLDPAGCRRMSADLVEFFSGAREPRFSFVDVLPR